MNPHFQRASMLMEQSRFELAEDELRQALSQDPDDGMSHALLAWCLSSQEKYNEAQQEAEQAIHLAPDESFVYYAYASVLLGRNDFAKAKSVIETAIGMDPYSEQYFAMLAQIEYQRKDWNATLDAADAGLKLDPEDVACTNLRAMALVKLGKNIDAQESLKTALKRAPEDPFAHANLGWSMLEKNEPQKAMEHFREALRLDPEMEWARAGIVEAMKARYFIYRIMLNWFLWMAKLQQKAQFGVLIGAYIGYVLLNRIAIANPALAPWINPLLIAYIVFAMMTWLSVPLFNLVLRTNKFGRLALSDEQVRTSTWVGLCVAGAVGMLIAYAFTGAFEFLGCAVAIALIIPPISRVYNCSPGWPRSGLALIAIALGIWGAIISICLIVGYLSSGERRLAMIGFGGMFFLPFVFSSVAAQFATNFFVVVQPRLGNDRGKLVWRVGLVVISISALLLVGFIGLVFAVASPSDVAMFSHPIVVEINQVGEVPWTDADLAEQYTRQLRDLGFRIVGDYRIADNHDSYTRIARSNDGSVSAEISQSVLQPVHVGFSSQYSDGAIFTLSNGSESLIKLRPKKTLQSAELPSDALYEKFLKERPQEDIRTLTDEELLESIVDDYNKEIGYLLARGGPSEREFRNIGENAGRELSDSRIKQYQRLWRQQASDALHDHVIMKLKQQQMLDEDPRKVFCVSGLMTKHQMVTALAQAGGTDVDASANGDAEGSGPANEWRGDADREQFAEVASKLTSVTKVASVKSPIPVDVYAHE